MTEKKVVDWEAIEPQYRAGIRSLEDIGKEYGVTKAAIHKHAKKHDWTRDLSKRIAAKADAKVNAAAVNDSVNAQRAVSERQVIDAAVDLQYRVRMKARRDIEELEELVFMLMAELKTQTKDPGAFEELGDLMRAEDDRGQDKRNDLYNRVISSSSRIDSAKKLVEMVERLVLLKFKLFGVKIDDDGSGDRGGIEDFLKRLGEKGV